MKTRIATLYAFLLCVIHPFTGIAQDFETDIFETNAGPLEISFISHGTLMFKFHDKIIHVDPVSRYADYHKLPPADLILITHEHGDHLDAQAIDIIKRNNTEIILTPACNDRYRGTRILKNGETTSFEEIKIEAVAAYNILHERAPGQPFHPKGRGNGYVLHFANTSVYIAGDTEDIPEMQELKNISIAFLPMNLPYTMTPEMTAHAAQLIRPHVLYPYHYGNTNPTELVRLLKGSGIEVRIRDLQ